MTNLEGGRSTEQKELSNKGVLAQLAIAAIHMDVPTTPIIAGPRHELDPADRPEPGTVLGYGWVLTPALAADDAHRPFPTPGYASSSTAELFAFYPNAANGTLEASPQTLDLTAVDEAWLARTAVAAQTYMQVPGYVAWGLQMQTDGVGSPAQPISL